MEVASYCSLGSFRLKLTGWTALGIVMMIGIAYADPGLISVESRYSSLLRGLVGILPTFLLETAIYRKRRGKCSEEIFRRI